MCVCGGGRRKEHERREAVEIRKEGGGEVTNGSLAYITSYNVMSPILCLYACRVN